MTADGSDRIWSVWLTARSAHTCGRDRDRGRRTGGWRHPGLDGLEGAGVYYGATVSEAEAMAGKSAFMVGGGNSAGQAALHLARFAARRGSSSGRRSRGEHVPVPDRRSATTRTSACATRTEVVGGDSARPPRAARARTGTDRGDRAGGYAVVLIGAAPAHRVGAGGDRRDEWGYVAHRHGRTVAGRSSGAAPSRPACPASSPPATSAQTRSSGWPRPRGRALWPSATCTPISLWSRPHDDPLPADLRRSARGAHRRARDPPRGPRDGRALGAPPRTSGWSSSPPP